MTAFTTLGDIIVHLHSVPQTLLCGTPSNHPVSRSQKPRSKLKQLLNVDRLMLQ